MQTRIIFYGLMVALYFLSSVRVLAEDKTTWIDVVRTRGEVKYMGEKLQAGSLIKPAGMLVTGARSYVLLDFGASGGVVNVGPNSKMDLKPPQQGAYSFSFINGVCRWVSKKRRNNKRGKWQVRTQAASLGVRGTDFQVYANELLGETEVVVFSGKVAFRNRADKADEKVLVANQWGGVGGRFGAKIGQVLDLPSNVINAFKQKLGEK